MLMEGHTVGLTVMTKHLFLDDEVWDEGFEWYEENGGIEGGFQMEMKGGF